VVLAWWGPYQLGARPDRVRLAGLEPRGRYLEAGTDTEHSGAALMRHGLPLPEEGASDYGSTLVRLARVPPVDGSWVAGRAWGS
jgi:hypothetical protein